MNPNELPEYSIHAHALWRTQESGKLLSVAQIQAAMNEHSAELLRIIEARPKGKRVSGHGPFIDGISTAVSEDEEVMPVCLQCGSNDEVRNYPDETDRKFCDHCDEWLANMSPSK